MKFWELIIEALKGQAEVGIPFQRSGKNYYARIGNTGYTFTAEGTILRRQDLTRESSRKPYAPGYTQPQS